MTRVAMLLENNPYPEDVRVRAEAESLAAAGHGVTVIAPRGQGQPRRETIAGVRVRRFALPETPATPVGFLAEYSLANLRLHLGGAAELLRGARVLHLHNPPDTLFGIGFLARALGREVVFDHHDLAPELFEAKFGAGSPLLGVLRRCERLTFGASTLVIAANESHREIAETRGGVAAERIVVVRNGPPAAAFAGVGPGRAGRLESPRLLFLGSLESQDGVDDLIPLLALLREHGLPGAQLTVVGDGSRRPPLEAAARAAGLGERVRFTGRVPHAEVPALLAAADVCLDPAPCTPLNERSTMIKIAEYMAAQRPIVAFPLLETKRTAGNAVAYAEPGDLGSFAAAVAELAAEP